MLQVMNTMNLNRKFRWAFTLVEHLTCDLGLPAQKVHETHFVKMGFRPSQELNFLNEDRSKELERIISDPERRKALKHNVTSFAILGLDSHDISNYFGTVWRFIASYANVFESKELEWQPWGGVLELYDGCGTLIERWTMNRIAPLSVNFGELDYTTSDEIDIELTIIYDKIEYKSFVETIDDKLKKSVPEQKKDVGEHFLNMFDNTML